MSRIGKSPISIPDGVTVTIKDSVVNVKGKLGELSQEIKEVSVKEENGEIILETTNGTKGQKAKHGLYRSTIWLLEFLKVLPKNWNW